MAKAQPPAIDAGVPAATTFEIIGDREGRARAIEAQLPATWQPKVWADFAGYPQLVELVLPAGLEPFAAIEQLLRERAALFGIRGALTHLDESLQNRRRYGAGRRWTGAIDVVVAGAKVTLTGHLWPIETAPVTTSAESVVAPYYGRHAVYLSRCLPGCGHPDSNVVLSAESFSLRPGMALICVAGHVTVRPAIAIEPQFRGKIDGNPVIPTLVDATTLAPIAGLDYYLPGDGVVTETGPVFGFGAGTDNGDCWRPSAGR